MLNKVMLIGRLGADPEIRYTQNGTAVANFSLATTEYRGSGKERTEFTEWHKCVAWDKLADVAGYLKTGRLVYVEGRLHTDTWEDQEGISRKTTEIVLTSLKFLSPKDKEEDSDGQEDKRERDVKKASERDQRDRGGKTEKQKGSHRQNTNRSDRR